MKIWISAGVTATAGDQLVFPDLVKPNSGDAHTVTMDPADDSVIYSDDTASPGRRDDTNNTTNSNSSRQHQFGTLTVTGEPGYLFEIRIEDSGAPGGVGYVAKILNDAGTASVITATNLTIGTSTNKKEVKYGGTLTADSSVSELSKELTIDLTATITYW
jgi:hypothetical protein